jgi:hypothetical protein
MARTPIMESIGTLFVFVMWRLKIGRVDLNTFI